MELNELSLAELRELAKNEGITHVTALRKAELVDVLEKHFDEDKKETEKKKEAEKKPSSGAPEKNRGARTGTSLRTRQSEKNLRTEKTVTDERQENPERTTRQDKPEIVERPEKPVKSDRPEKSERPDRVEKSERPERPEKSERPDKPARPEIPANVLELIGDNPEEVARDACDVGGHIGMSVDRLYELASGEKADGILEVMTEGGYGFIRSDNYLSGDRDIYVSYPMIKRLGLRTGDHISGGTRTRNTTEDKNGRFASLLFITSVNGRPLALAKRRPDFEKLTPIYPNERIKLAGEGSPLSLRIMDLLSPIGKGQRGMIVSPPKAGKTTLLKQIAKSVIETNPEMTLIVLLIDERPEEVTDIKEAIEAPGRDAAVIYSTFDELPDHHRRVAEMVLARAKRLVESGRDVMILLDSITRLARAYNHTVTPSGRTLSGGLDPAALFAPKRFFGAARNMRQGGSLTILATALVETGSRMDDVVFEEFKGTGNMELVLDRKLSEKRVFPAIDIAKSGTRNENLLLTEREQETIDYIRKSVSGLKSEEACENVVNLFAHTKNNEDFMNQIKKTRLV